MARSVNVWITDITQAGQSWNYQALVRFEWVDNGGNAHSQEGRVTLTSLLAQMDREWLDAHMPGLLIDAYRESLGVDE